jgi:hypothetical protein
LLVCGWLAECLGVRARSSADPRVPDHLVAGAGGRWLRGASPDDTTLQKAVCAEIEGGTSGDTLARVRLTDSGKSPAGELLAGLAPAPGSATASGPADDAGCVFVFAEHDRAGFTRWPTTSQIPPHGRNAQAPATT